MMKTLALFSVACSIVSSQSILLNQYSECDRWAKVDNECINNPNFMWTSCIRSCSDYSTDDNEKCPAWAEEGECTNNPRYIQIHCPSSCKNSIVWNPWTRNTLGASC